MRALYAILTITLLGLLGSGIYLNKKKGFSPEAVRFSFPYRDAWDRNPDDLTLHLLNQPFHYLGKGARSYAFLSEDGEYVLKLFKYRYHYPHWAASLPDLPPFRRYIAQKKKKVSLETVLNGYHIADLYDKEGTGLLFVHLNSEDKGLPQATLFDKTGARHTVDLNNTRFVLQKKVTELKQILEESLSRGDTELAKRRIRQTFDLYQSHFDQGLLDLGMGIIKNNGFIGEQPIHFDLGKLTIQPGMKNRHKQKERLVLMRDKVSAWIKRRHPLYHKEIERSIDDYLHDQEALTRSVSSD